MHQRSESQSVQAFECHLIHIVATDEQGHWTNTGQSCLTPTAILAKLILAQLSFWLEHLAANPAHDHQSIIIFINILMVTFLHVVSSAASGIQP